MYLTDCYPKCLKCFCFVWLVDWGCCSIRLAAFWWMRWREKRSIGTYLNLIFNTIDQIIPKDLPPSIISDSWKARFWLYSVFFRFRLPLQGKTQNSRVTVLCSRVIKPITSDRVANRGKPQTKTSQTVTYFLSLVAHPDQHQHQYRYNIARRAVRLDSVRHLCCSIDTIQAPNVQPTNSNGPNVRSFGLPLNY